MRLRLSRPQASPQKLVGAPVILSASCALLWAGSKRSGVSAICLLLVSISYSLCPATRMRGSIIP